VLLACCAELSDKNVRVLVFGNLNRANATLYIEHMAEQKGIPLPTTPDERTELMERIYQASMWQECMWLACHLSFMGNLCQG
jgi:hypothetical protein